MQQWRLIIHPSLTGHANMAADEAILRSVASGNAPPTLRLYGWEPFCLSLGYGQRVSDVDMSRLEQFGWHLVRRPTGGKAILHGDELTYSITMPKAHPLASGGIVDTYLRLSRVLLNAMRSLGLGVAAEDGSTSSADSGPVCFEVPSKYEITVGGKKLIGSAQMRRYDGVLQHGTIPLQGDIARICDGLMYTSEQQRIESKIAVRERATTLEGVGLTGITWQQMADKLVHAFSETLEVQLDEQVLGDTEKQLADELYQQVYITDEWNCKR